MRRILLLLLMILVLSSCKEQLKLEDINLEIHDFDSFEKYLHKDDNTTYIVNFWATWCAPCVEELPHFEEIYHNYKDKNVKLLLVSLDFPDKYETKLKPFMVKHSLKGKVICLDDVAMNEWIPKVNKEWDGGLPATLIYNKSKREFFYRPFTYNELENELKNFLN